MRISVSKTLGTIIHPQSVFSNILVHSIRPGVNASEEQYLQPHHCSTTELAQCARKGYTTFDLHATAIVPVLGQLKALVPQWCKVDDLAMNEGFEQT